MSNVDTQDKVEAILNDIKDSLAVENKVSEEIAKSADAMVASQLEKFEALNKSVETLSEKLDGILNSIAALNIPTQEEIEKAVEAKAEEITKNVEASVEEKTEELAKKVENLENEPVVKSATVVVEDAVEVVEEEAPKATRQDLITKALAEITNTQDTNRKAQLFKAISRLEAGVSIDKIEF